MKLFLLGLITSTLIFNLQVQANNQPLKPAKQLAAEVFQETLKKGTDKELAAQMKEFEKEGLKASYPNTDVSILSAKCVQSCDYRYLVTIAFYSGDNHVGKSVGAAVFVNDLRQEKKVQKVLTPKVLRELIE